MVLQDEEVRVRRNASKTLTILADVEPRVAVILVESSIGEDDRQIGVRHKGAEEARHPESEGSPDDTKGAADKDLEMRRACIADFDHPLWPRAEGGGG